MKKPSTRNFKKNKKVPEERNSLKEKNKLIQDLKDKVKKLEKRIKFLENELLNILKPVRIRKGEEVSVETQTLNNFKKEFVEKYRKIVKEEEQLE